MRIRALLVVAVSLGALVAVTKPVEAAPAVGITVEFSCDDGGWLITSPKNLSNIVFANPDHHRIVFDTATKTYLLVADDVTTIWVKSGNNQSGDGPGYGQRFDVTEPDCGGGPVDADGDGYTEDVDCNDDDAGINPGAVDIPNDGIDQNCDGADLVVGDGQVRATLTWDTDDDIDLAVIDPNGDRIWWGFTSSPSGGLLDRDDNVALCGVDPEPGGVENIFWAPDTAPSGTYTVEIHGWVDCAPAGTRWHLQVFVDSVVVVDESGTNSATNEDPFNDPYGPVLFSTTFNVA